PIWINTFVNPSYLKSCPTLHNNGTLASNSTMVYSSGKVWGTPCQYDGSTLLEILENLPSIPYGSIDVVSNSATGRICPLSANHNGTHATYTTTITFRHIWSSGYDTMNANKIIAGTLG